jgi:hypothetical protein
MRDEVWISIPTYWGKNCEDGDDGEAMFDHPTDITAHQTLERTIANITEFKDDFKILVILALTQQRYHRRAREQVERILSRYSDRKDIYLVSERDIDDFNSLIALSPLNLKSYGAIRNVQIALPYLMGCTYVIAIDDDEIVMEKDYFKRISHLMKDDEIDLLTGVYLNKDGGYLIPCEQSKERGPFEQKLNLMNKQMTLEMSDEIQPHRTHVGFGGNMIFSRKIIENICFDEFIARGEDFDYILNSLASNFSVYFDKSIAITHLPVSHKRLEREVTVDRDIKRHIYTFYKKQALNWDVDQKIYPGAFLEDIDDLKRYSIIAYHKESQGSLYEAAAAVNRIESSAFEHRDIYTQQKLSWLRFIEIFHKSDKVLNLAINWIKGVKLL